MLVFWLNPGVLVINPQRAAFILRRPFSAFFGFSSLVSFTLVPGYDLIVKGTNEGLLRFAFISPSY